MRLQGSAETPEKLLGIVLLPQCVQLAAAVRRGAQRRLQLHSEALRAEDGETASACAAALKRALKKLRQTPQHVAMALPDSAVAQRRLTLPAGLSISQRDTALRAEAQGLLPHPLAELHMDYRILPEASAARSCTVQLAVCRRACLEPLQTVATLAGLRLERIGIASQAQQQGRRLLRQPGLHTDSAVASGAGRAALEISCGLTADAGFNFLPWRQRQRRAQRKKFVLTLALLTVTVQLAAAAGAWHLRQTEQSLLLRTQSLDRQYRQLQARETARQQRRAERARLQTHSATLRRFHAANLRLPRLLAEMPTLLPQGVRLNRLTLHGERLHLWGSADSAAQLTRLLSLMRSRGMRDAELDALRAADQALRHDFSLRARLPETPGP